MYVNNDIILKLLITHAKGIVCWPKQKKIIRNGLIKTSFFLFANKNALQKKKEKRKKKQ